VENTTEPAGDRPDAKLAATRIERQGWFLAGLFIVTLSTLALEITNTRLLSVTTWYHLSFFAVSTAMFGMAAGAVRVYLGGSEFEGKAARSSLARYATWLSLSIPFFTVVSLCIPIPGSTSPATIVATLVVTIVIAVPFYLSGICVAISLTRIPGPSGLVYAFDLLGAALGSVVVLLLFEFSNITSAMFALGAVAALGAAALHHFAGSGRLRRQVVLAVALAAVAWLNQVSDHGLRTIWAKGVFMNPSAIELEYWTIHGQVTVRHPHDGKASYWAKSFWAKPTRVNQRPMTIDGAAGTNMTRWDGQVASLEWTQHDVTAFPYLLRKGGDNAVIGVGGGRDILAALWAGSTSVTGVEINEAFIDLLEGPLRDYAKIADDPRVTLVHDEARSYMTRLHGRFDTIQMSLIDTWAATGAGAFTLSENGLYTVEAWQGFLGALKPGGMFSVSRWYSPKFASETSRLVSLAIASLLEAGIEQPRRHLMLVARKRVATLLISNQPFSAMDLRTLAELEQSSNIRVLLAPDRESTHELLAAIAACRSIDEIERTVAGLPYDYTPPTDERPYFFNILRPDHVIGHAEAPKSTGVMMAGNLVATYTLMILWLISLVLVVVTIIGPLARSGLPDMARSDFALSVLYFALIGAGFMFVQIPMMQRFSVYLGHPSYSLGVILFSMVLATGAGSLLSDRLDIETSAVWTRIAPIVIAANLLIWTLAIQPIIDGTVQHDLFSRAAVTAAVVGLASFPLGFCFPFGLRLVARISPAATPWLWGVNGAAGVLASVTAVAVSMWSGISVSLYIAALAYALLLIPSTSLWRRGRG
jgi:hypothetical protein